MALDMLKLTRDENFIKSNCKMIGDSLVAAKDISLFIPTYYLQGKLLSLDKRYYSYAAMMYTDGSKYAVINLLSMLEVGAVEYSKTMVIGFDGVEQECYELRYTKGDVIHPSKKVLQNNQILYDIVKQLLLSGRCPAFFDRDDYDSFLDSSLAYANVRLPEYGYTNHYTEMVVRSIKDIQLPARLSKEKGFSVIPFSSVILNVASPLDKMNGGYAEDGIMSATTITSETLTPFEKILRE